MPTQNDSNDVRNRAFNYLSKFGKNIKTKLNNVCSKTGQYDVPSELFQKRTPRSNRVLISWKTVQRNNLTMEQLRTFEGGVVVEFKNNDFFNENNKSNTLFNDLSSKIGSDDLVSAIITIRSEDGSSSSSIPREAFKRLISNTKVLYKGSTVVINEGNYNDYAIKQISSGGTGNEKWSGFLYVSIRGGQQDTIETHHGKELTIFNPACEYASQRIRIDIDLVCAYFMMHSLNENIKSQEEYKAILSDIEKCLSESEYCSESFKGNLLDYCKSHPSLKMFKDKLYDPIQVKEIKIDNFDLESRQPESIDFTHDEAVNLDKYYWDEKKQCLLSPARPSNIFWSFHLSNMMQQDSSLNDYFKEEKKRVSLRKKLLKKFNFWKFFHVLIRNIQN